MGQETREGKPVSKVGYPASHLHGQQRLCLQGTSGACTKYGPPLGSYCLGVGVSSLYPAPTGDNEAPKSFQPTWAQECL